MLTIDEFRAAIASSRRRLVVDLRGCSFMDLGGLRCLEEARASGPVTLIPSRQVRRLLELTATTHLFDIEEGFDEEVSGQHGSTAPDG